MQSPTEVADVPQLLREANRLLGAGSPDRAAAFAVEALRRAPTHPGARALAGMAILAGGDAAGAIEHLSLACHGLPENAALRGNLATALARAGRTEAALDQRRWVLVLTPADGGAAAALASASGRAADWARAAMLNPGDPGPWYNCGVSRVLSGDLHGAAAAYRVHGQLLHRFEDPPARPVSRLSCLHRLEHDRDQLDHLRDQGLLPAGLEDEPERYQTLIETLTDAERSAVTFTLDEERFAPIARSYNRFVHLHRTGWQRGRPALNETLDWPGLEAAFLAGTPRALAIDGLLRADALAALRRLCWTSTFWHQIKGAGYLGAYFREGFCDPLIVEIAEQLKAAFPRVLGPLPVRVIWAYSYAQGRVGINPHADFAGVNLNFWIAPEEANLDPETGGLVVYRKAAPADWDFRTYNTASAEFIYAHLGESRDDFIRFPHRANRAALFDSRLIHETDRFSFAPGHTNRRINITMLFGEGG